MPLTNHSGRQSRPHFGRFLKKENGSIRKDNIMDDKKQKYAYWLRTSQVSEMESMLDEANAKSKSDFVTQAIKFYIGYLHGYIPHRFYPKPKVFQRGQAV